MANGRIKTFVNNDIAGQQYLFTKSDFNLLQVWVVWMIYNHHHDTSVNTGSVGGQILDSNVKAHQTDVHPTDEIPVGFTQTSVDGTLQLAKDDGTSIQRNYLTVADHVSHEGIHTISEQPDNPVVDVGTLIARGWTKPIFVRAVISSPLFEISGYGTKGPIFMPFPHYNMSPVAASPHNRKNQMDIRAASPITAPLVNWKDGNDLTMTSDTLSLEGTVYNLDGDLAAGAHDGYVYSKGGYRSFEKEMERGKYPYVSDAKSQLSTQFYNPFHSFLYVIPPYLSTPVNLDIEFDVLTGQTFSQDDFALFFHSPLFIDSKHTRLLDHVKRSGVTAGSILNFKDLVGIYGRDVEKQDLFSTASHRSHTCWLSKYRPIAVQDDRSSIGYGCALMFNEYDQEVNQFLSQVNYAGAKMRKGNEHYYDYPFRVVTMDCKIESDVLSDEDYLEVYGTETGIKQGLAVRGFPRCFYRTDYESYPVRAGGHLNDTLRPKEEFEFTVFPNALGEVKDHINNLVHESKDVDDYYFDTLNVPHHFTDGKRQVLILKDPDIYREESALKKNPYSNLRTAGYVIIEGYISVPYEIYSTGFSMSAALSGGTMSIKDTLDGDATGNGNWQDSPDELDKPFTLPGSAPPESNTVTPPGGTSPGGGNIDDTDNIDDGGALDEPIVEFMPPPDETTPSEDDESDETASGGSTPEEIVGIVTGDDGITTPESSSIAPPSGGSSGAINPPGGGFDTIIDELKHWMQYVDECEEYRAGNIPQSPIMDYICCLEELGLNWWEFVNSTILLTEEPALHEIVDQSTLVDCADCRALFDCLVAMGNSEAMALYIMSQYADRCITECDTSTW